LKERESVVEQEVAKRIERESATLTEFGAHIEPALRVAPGERFVVETQDNFFGEIKTEEDLPTPENLPFLRTQFWTVNPVAGPVYVEGLRAGDLLVLEIEDIIPSERGWTGFVPDFGNLAKNADFPELQQPYARITHHRPGPSKNMMLPSGAQRRFRKTPTGEVPRTYLPSRRLDKGTKKGRGGNDDPRPVHPWGPNP